MCDHISVESESNFYRHFDDGRGIIQPHQSMQNIHTHQYISTHPPIYNILCTSFFKNNLKIIIINLANGWLMLKFKKALYFYFIFSLQLVMVFHKTYTLIYSTLIDSVDSIGREEEVPYLYMGSYSLNPFDIINICMICMYIDMCLFIHIDMSIS